MDKVLITMPLNAREFFFAMATIQDYIYQYIQEVAHKPELLRDPYFHFTFRMNDEFEKFELPLKVAKDNNPDFDYTGWTEKCRSEFTNFIDFDFKAAEKISLCTRKHITESLGILIGSSPKKWPILPAPRCTQGKGILILPWSMNDEAHKLKEHLGANSKFQIPSTQSMDTIEALELDTTEAVIGPASVFTYLAAAYDRTVIEIFPDKRSYVLYNNEGISNYRAIIGKDVSVDAVIQAWQSLTIEDINFDDLELLSAE